MELFPEAARTNLIKGYFGYTGIPLTDDSDDEEESRAQQSGGTIEGYADMIIVRAQAGQYNRPY